MGEVISNLLIVNGSKKEVAKFKKEAFLNESREFCFEKQLPIPEYPNGKPAVEGNNEILINWKMKYYGNIWGNSLSVIFYETPEEIHYFFNSKDQEADIWRLPVEYENDNLTFVHVFYNHYHDFGSKYGIRTYRNNAKLIDSYHVYDNHYDYDTNIFEEVFSLNLETMLHTPAQLEEIYFKLKLLGSEKELELVTKSFDYVDQCIDNKKESKVIDYTQKDCFYNYYPKQQFLMENARFYNNLFSLEKKLWTKKMKWAKEIAYPLEINPNNYINKFNTGISNKIASKIINDKLLEIEQNDITCELKLLLDYFNSFGYKKEIKVFSERFLDNCISRIDDFLVKFNSPTYKTASKEYDEIIAYPEEYWKINYDDFIADYVMGEDLRDTEERWASKDKIAEYMKKWEQVPKDLSTSSPNKSYREELHSIFEEAIVTDDYDMLKKHIIQSRNYENEVVANLELCRKKYNSEGIIFESKVELGATKGFTILENRKVSYEDDLPF